MGFNEEYMRFNYYIESGIESLRDDEGWSDGKIAFYLRDMAQSISPKGRTSKKITIDPLKITKRELLKYPKEIQDKVNNIKKMMTAMQPFKNKNKKGGRK